MTVYRLVEHEELALPPRRRVHPRAPVGAGRLRHGGREGADVKLRGPRPRYPPGMADASTPWPGPDSPIKQAMFDLRDGKRTFDDVLKFLVGWKWAADPDPGEFNSPEWWTSIANSAFLPSTPGSWDEVQEAADRGFLTREQFQQVYDAVVLPRIKDDAPAT